MIIQILVGNLANFIKPENKSQLEICDDPNGYWNDFKMNQEKLRKKLVVVQFQKMVVDFSHSKITV